MLSASARTQAGGVEWACNNRVGIYKLGGDLPAGMGEEKGRGSRGGIAAVDVCFTPLTRLGSRLRFVPRHPPLGNKGGLVLVPCHSARLYNLRARSESDMPFLRNTCATLDGVRRLQRLGYREGLCLCRAVRHGPFNGLRAKSESDMPSLGQQGRARNAVEL